jgi:hypothetical protein
MTDERAADLPVGSIIANDHTAWIKVSKADNDLGCWSATSDELATYDWEPQEALNSGAVVVRRGTGR